MDAHATNLEALDRAYFFHPSTPLGKHARGETPERVIVGGKGIRIVDDRGRQSLDAFAGLYCVNVGYGRSEIARAIADQAEKLAYYHAYVGHASEAAIRLAARIVKRAPPNMRGRVIGLYNMALNGLRIGSGFTVGFAGAAIGIHWSLGLSSLGLIVACLPVLLYIGRKASRPGEVTPAGEGAEVVTTGERH